VDRLTLIEQFAQWRQTAVTPPSRHDYSSARVRTVPQVLTLLGNRCIHYETERMV